MEKKKSKQLLFEMMGKVNPNFKIIKENVNKSIDLKKAKDQLNEWFEYLNPDISYIIEGGESIEFVYFLEINKNRFYDINDLKKDLKQDFPSSSHGVEGNPGGTVIKSYIKIEDDGDYWNVELGIDYVYDI